MNTCAIRIRIGAVQSFVSYARFCGSRCVAFGAGSDAARWDAPRAARIAALARRMGYRDTVEAGR